MAKKKEKKGTDGKNEICSALANRLGIITRENSRSETGGVLLKTFAERWLYDSNVIRFGELYMFAGESSSGKSQFMINTAANFAKAGGYGIIIDTEHKYNAEATIIPNVGEELYYSGRLGYLTAGSVDTAKAVSLGDDKAIEEHLKAWQDILRQQVQEIKKDPVARTLPFFIGVDSLLGAASSISRAKYDEGGGDDGRSGAGMARAASITEFLTNFSTDLAGTNITVGFVNHGKTKVSMGSFNRGGPTIQLPGGDAPKFHCSTILYFKKGKRVTKMSVGGRSVRINVFKNSFGDDQRGLDVIFYYDILRDSGDNVIRDDNGNPRRRILWDWDEATAQILKKYCLGEQKERIGAARKVFPGLKMSRGLVSCKTYGFDGITSAEFGREVIRNPELYQKMLEIPRLSIHHAPDSSVFEPDWSGDIAQTVSDGSWDTDADANEEEEE